MKEKLTLLEGARVAFIAPRFHTNQVEIVRYLVSRGVTVWFGVAGVGRSEMHEDIMPEQLDFVNCALLRRWVRDFDNNPSLNLYRFGLPSWASVQVLLRECPDLAIIRMPFSTIGLTAALLLRARGAKLVFYTQTPLHRQGRGIKDALLNWFARATHAAWITPCRGDAGLGVPLKNAHFVPFSTSPHRYVKEWFRDGRIAIIMVGKFLPRKRHDLFLDALARLPDPSAFRVTLVGELSHATGMDTMDAILEKIRPMKFEVDIRTNLPYQEVMALYRDHDLFVLPSENESASVSNLEAMANGLPVIVSSCNRTSDYAGASGWVFRSRSVDDLAGVLETALSNRDELRRRGLMAWDVVDRHFTPDKVYGPFFKKFLPLCPEEQAQ